MTDVVTFDRNEEKAILEEWFETTQFDAESEGVPPLPADEDDDE